MNLERYAEVKAATVAIGVVMAILFVIAGSWPAALLCSLSPGSALTSGSRGRPPAPARIERDLPDFVDILSITVRPAGYRAALNASRSLTARAEEVLRRCADDLATRREAFEGLRANSSETLDAFVAAQLQPELACPADALAAIRCPLGGATPRRRSGRSRVV